MPSLYQALGPNDFTKPGEEIPQEGGLSNFIQYNVAHRDPVDTAIHMGMASGGIKNIKNPVAKMYEALTEATQPAGPADAAIAQANKTDQQLNLQNEGKNSLDRFLGTAESYGGIPPQPKLSIGPLKQIQNLSRTTK